jgi:hypothetical protein
MCISHSNLNGFSEPLHLDVWLPKNVSAVDGCQPHTTLVPRMSETATGLRFTNSCSLSIDYHAGMWNIWNLTCQIMLQNWRIAPRLAETEAKWAACGGRKNGFHAWILRHMRHARRRRTLQTKQLRPTYNVLHHPRVRDGNQVVAISLNEEGRKKEEEKKEEEKKLLTEGGKRFAVSHITFTIADLSFARGSASEK